jgi:hypothetical protein
MIRKGRGFRVFSTPALKAVGRLLAAVFMGVLGRPGDGQAAELTELMPQDLDPAALATWEGGRESPLTDANARNPQWVVGTRDSRPAHSGVFFGVSKMPGPRHLRVGFKHEVLVGSLLVAGGGKVSVLKPGAPYPGDPADESEWLPAERENSLSSPESEVPDDGYALWNLPAATRTRALRFTHVAKPADATYAGWLGGAYMLAERLTNVAPRAVAMAGSNNQDAGKLNNESKDGTWYTWDNMSSRSGVRRETIGEKPEWVMLVWPQEVTLNGLALLGAGFGAADVQIFTGRPERGPRDADETDWKTVSQIRGLKNHYPSTLGVDWVDFDGTVSTRAVRLRLTAATDEGHPHMSGKTMNGKRVWLAELMALQPLTGNSSHDKAVPPVTAQEPIPVEFTLPEDALVTLVIEDQAGRRVRNLVAETPFPRGRNTVYWDGTDDLGRDLDAANHGLYSIPARLVAAGDYQVRGLWRKPVHLRYEFAVNSPGDPPWPTADGSGGWTTNHTPVSSVLFLPADKAPGGRPLIYLGSHVSEGGAALAWVDPDGRKKGGRGPIGGAWTGAQFLARDEGAEAEPGVLAYVGAAWTAGGRKNQGEVLLTALTKSGDQKVLQHVFDLPGGTDGAAIAETLGGLAVHNGLVVFSQTSLNQLVFVRAGKVAGTVAMPSPRGLAFDRRGRLLVLTDHALLRHEVADGAGLGAGETIAAQLEDPTGLALDAAGDIYVAERGTRHQVKRLSPRGVVECVYGTPGRPKAGPYDRGHMNNPRGLAVDANGRLWVAEEDFWPKRVSVWNRDGSLWRAFYGPPRYGGGGSLDPRDRTRFDYDGMEFRLDWRTGESRLECVLYRPGPGDLPLASRSGEPQTPVYIGERRYLTNAFTQNPTNGHNTAFLFADRGGAAVPVAAMGRADEWDALKDPALAARRPPGAGDKPAWFAWSDLNGDGRVQPEEVTWLAGDGGGVTVQGDGSFVIARMGVTGDQPGRVRRFRPTRVTPQGVPVYDLAAGESIAGAAQPPLSTGGEQALAGTEGWAILTTAPRPFSAAGIGGVKDGVSRWSYPSLWPGLHASHSAPVPDFAGELIGTTRLLGDFVTPKTPEAGPLFFLNGNLGSIYVFTQDGLMVASLFRDARQGQAWTAPTARRGLSLDEVSPGEEHFFPTVTQMADGTIDLVAGGIFSAVVRVEGLDTIRRIRPFPLHVTAGQLADAGKLAAQREAARQAGLGSGRAKVMLHPREAELTETDWAAADWVDIDRRGTAAHFNASTAPYAVTAAVAVAGGQLWARWKTGDAQLLNNSGALETAPFKTGGALDLMLGTDPGADPHRLEPVAGDVRLLVTQVRGKTKALLYRAVVPGTPPEQRVVFRSPARTLAFDRVDDVSARVQLTADDRGGYQIKVPLELLGWAPQPGARFRGDIGILRGNGAETVQRVYWSNKATALLADVPGEAALSPDLWGTFASEPDESR